MKMIIKNRYSGATGSMLVICKMGQLRLYDGPIKLYKEYWKFMFWFGIYYNVFPIFLTFKNEREMIIVLGRSVIIDRDDDNCCLKQLISRQFGSLFLIAIFRLAFIGILLRFEWLLNFFEYLMIQYIQYNNIWWKGSKRLCSDIHVLNLERFYQYILYNISWASQIKTSKQILDVRMRHSAQNYKDKIIRGIVRLNQTIEKNNLQIMNFFIVLYRQELKQMNTPLKHFFGYYLCIYFEEEMKKCGQLIFTNLSVIGQKVETTSRNFKKTYNIVQSTKFIFWMVNLIIDLIHQIIYMIVY
ncbi:unnamed protein product [Paramecium sonneborni]|uniref:Uncharacterized protein n=1 Tax=Paramecium sonneborni TaxID=65129 RepID=A0A8S1RT72_9CILI|nr:unnamed protein product [Paramecium sonneborni]